jgi:hypothetical protein
MLSSTSAAVAAVRRRVRQLPFRTGGWLLGVCAITPKFLISGELGLVIYTGGERRGWRERWKTIRGVLDWTGPRAPEEGARKARAGFQSTGAGICMLEIRGVAKLPEHPLMMTRRQAGGGDGDGEIWHSAPASVAVRQRSTVT